ncbi:prophage regulatory protein [Escherichia coli]|nr:PerC family transcriptional regulator [Escherichia coli]MJM92284.1 PerC family transcriptional regulator [Shigella sonnei]EIY1832511.1 PerC family transcriptional regulator [Escherichia coli]EKI4315209.1 PerC family transcriptional regulator [Escherichia coli]CTW94274.1 prophage regulatory protein [Escherichia coli]
MTAQIAAYGRLVETDKERHHITMRRLECCRKAQRPPEPPDNYGDLKKAVDRTYAEMGMDGAGDEIWRNYQDSQSHIRSNPAFCHVL